MPSNNIPLQAFNRGIVSKLALARTDIDRIALSAEVQTNWMPRVLGSMMLRPGLQYLGQLEAPRLSFLKFIFATDDTALIELTNGAMRVWDDDSLVTRTAVTTTITNGGFNSDLSGWTVADESGASTVWSEFGARLKGTGFNSAILRAASDRVWQ